MREPKDLTQRQKVVWRWLKKLLPDSVDYEQIDETVIVLLINQMLRNAEAARMIEEHGLTTMGSRGQPVVSAFYKIEADTGKEIVKLSNELGLTPKARARLATGFSEFRREIADEAEEEGLAVPTS